MFEHLHIHPSMTMEGMSKQGHIFTEEVSDGVQKVLALFGTKGMQGFQDETNGHKWFRRASVSTKTKKKTRVSWEDVVTGKKQPLAIYLP